MVKDRKARNEARLSVIAIANVVAAIVDTMRDGGVPNDITKRFLDGLDALNRSTIWGAAGSILHDVVTIIRETVPDND